MNDPSIDSRLAALHARRPAAAVARPSGDLNAPTGAAVDLPPPLLAPTNDHLADPVVLAGTHRFGRRRSYPAGGARIGFTVAAAAGFLALVPVMGPLTAAENDDEPQPAPDEAVRREAVTIPDGAVESSIDLTTTTTSTVAPTGTLVVVPATTMPVPAAPVGPAAPTSAAAPVAPAPPARGSVAPAAPAPALAPTAATPSAPVAPVPAPGSPVPAPVAPAPAPVEPTPTAAPTTLAPVVTPPPTPPPTAAATTAPPAPPPPPTTTAPPPPPTTSPS